MWGKTAPERGKALARLFSEDAACHCERDADRTVDVDRTGARRHLVGDPLAAISAIDNLAGVCADELSPNVEALADERTVAQQLLADCVEFGEAIELPIEWPPNWSATRTTHPEAMSRKPPASTMIGRSFYASVRLCRCARAPGTPISDPSRLDAPRGRAPTVGGRSR